MTQSRLRNIGFKIVRTLQNVDMLPHIVGVAFQVYVLRRPIIKQAGIAVTYDCPCNCIFCSAQNVKTNQKPSLSVEDLETLIDSFAQSGALSICFSGGEPLVRKDIFRLIERVRKRKMLCSIITSCASYSEKLWKDLKKAGLNTLYFSIDGIGEAHDKFRGVPGLFDKVESAVKMSKELKIEFYFNGVVTNDNMQNGSIYEIIRYCQKEKIFFMILHTSASGKYAHPKYLLTEQNLLEFERIRKMDFVLWEGDGNLAKVGCPAGIETIFVTAQGDVMPCPFIEISFGNVKEMPLRDIILKMHSYELFGKITPICLMGADKDFYRSWLQPLRERSVPVEIEHHPEAKRQI